MSKTSRFYKINNKFIDNIWPDVLSFTRNDVNNLKMKSGFMSVSNSHLKCFVDARNLRIMFLNVLQRNDYLGDPTMSCK